MTPDVVILGGGLAGLATAAALGSASFRTTVLEARGFLGGRATSFPLHPSAEHAEIIDNCQHILLRCCVNLLDFYRRLGAEDKVRFFPEYFFVEPGGRVSTLAAGRAPAPLHLAGAFLRMRCLDAGDKFAIARALWAIRRQASRPGLESMTMLDWLREQRQTPRAIDRFWRQVLVSAVNEELERMAASHGFQVFRLAFLTSATAYQMGVPAVPLADLYAASAWAPLPQVTIRLRTAVEAVEHDGRRITGVVAGGDRLSAAYYVSALPLERLAALAPECAPDSSWLEHSPITGIHLWFDRPVMPLPHATLLDRTIQWAFNKDGGRYIQLVVSASRALLPLGRSEIVELALRELAEFFPAAGAARLVKSHVVKEVRATFSAKPGIESFRPEPETRFANFFLAGDWTRSGWPSTMEGAVRSGYRAAEAVAGAAGRPCRFLLPDIA